jgi:hypothetical protein
LGSVYGSVNGNGCKIKLRDKGHEKESYKGRENKIFWYYNPEKMGAGHHIEKTDKAVV